MRFVESLQLTHKIKTRYVQFSYLFQVSYYISTSERHFYLQGIHKRYNNLLRVKVPDLLYFGQQQYEPRLLDIKTLTTKVACALEAPAVVRARPIAELLDVHRDLVVDLLPPLRDLLDRVEELHLDLVQVCRDPLYRFGQGKLELVHDHRDDVVAVVVSGLLLVVR